MKFKSSIQPYKLTETGGIPLTNSVPETIDNITERIVSTYNCGKYKDQIRTILERTSEVWNRTLNLRVKDLMEVAESKECEQVLTFEPSFCDSLFFLRPENSVKIFETLDFNNLKLKENATPRLFSPSFQSIPFYTISELTDLVGNFKSFYEENKKPLIKFGYPKFHSINSVWLESLLGRLYFTKLPICMRINPEPSSEDFSYTWGDSSPLNGRVIWHKETPLLVYPSEYEKDFKILGLCDYEDAPDIDYLSDDQIQILNRIIAADADSRLRMEEGVTIV